MNKQRAIQQPGAAVEESRVVDFLGRVGEFLVPGERAEAWAVQRRAFALLSRRSIVVATTGRLLIFKRNLITGYRMREVRWQDVASARIRVGIFGADLNVGVLNGAKLATAKRVRGSVLVHGLRKAHAQDVYRLCATQNPR